jgi:hypothetical protein
MSGRRSSSVEGSPVGVVGTSVRNGVAGNAKDAGCCTDQHRDGVLVLRARDGDIDLLA